MRLCEILEGIPALECCADMETEIGGITCDSRAVQRGDLFVAVTGFSTDGHKYIPMAVERGAACILCEYAPEDADIPYVRVARIREAMASAAANFYRRPAEEMTVIGVTGTNGKTTTTYLLKQVLERTRGAKVGLIGTNRNLIGDVPVETEHTTPESPQLQQLLRRMRDEGCTHVVMEVSSHALALSRVYGIPFEVGIFTNLTQDHLDFHKTMEEYCAAKSRLFQMCKTGVVNADDPWSGRLTEDAACRIMTYGCEKAADLRGEEIRLEPDGVRFTARTEGESAVLHVGIPGGFMVYNTLDVLCAAKALGIGLSESAAALERSGSVSGRMERVAVHGNYTMLIDYAHTPDAVENVLRSVRGFSRGRVVALFGCGGDRDRGKRPKMGAIAARYADLVIVTTDNPRTEEPRGIIQDILAGMYESQTPHIVVEDRVEAIHYAMDHAQDGDVVVLMGKGHETYQIIGTQKHHMDEREIVAAYDAKRNAEP